MPLRQRISAEQSDSNAVFGIALLALGLTAGCGSPPPGDDAGWVRIEIEEDTASIDDADRLHLAIRSGTAVLFAATSGLGAPVEIDAADLPGLQRTFSVVLLTDTDEVTAVGDAGPVDLPADRHTTVVIPLREP